VVEPLMMEVHTCSVDVHKHATNWCFTMAF
jgi:hypothetical protein